MRSRNMQVLTGQIEDAKPGVTIYGIGDDEHKKHRSGHNEDDTPGSLPEDSDPDTLREHRAIDVMVTAAFSHDDAACLVNDLVSDADNRKRMLYVNYKNTQWARSNGWHPADNSDDPHPTHVHVSGEADDDANETPWKLPTLTGDTSAFPPFPGRHLTYVKGTPQMRGEDVRTWQARMRARGWVIGVDGEYGPQSAGVATRFQTEKGLTVDGIVGPQTWKASWVLPIT